ncbi:hypothetical protein VDGD_02678 [Verticillium dahliae]|nr:hypothetical protein VDGD_02678 [Verticillium dahliae]
MAPLILHNVPDDELYVGDDGVKRPYAMVFPQQDGLPGVRSRRGVAETGSFGRSTRRSRSRTGTPARRENPTLAAADKLFGSWVSNNAATITSANTSAPAGNLLGNAPQRKTSSQHLQQDDAAAASGASSTQRLLKSEPTEVILRGYRSSAQQYAAINHYEHLAGLICEDYPREPPPEQRRYKGDLRDPAFTRRRALTPEERAKVNRADGGEHWVKVTFESLEAADAALFSSPQTIQGCQVFAELYRGFPPHKDEAILDADSLVASIDEHHRSQSVPGPGFGAFGTSARRRPGAPQRTHSDLSPPGSHASSQTLDTATLSQRSATASSGTLPLTTTTTTPAASSSGSAAAAAATIDPKDALFCTHIPTARKVTLKPVEQAILPSQSFTAKLLAAVPFLMWFIGGFGAMIGNEVPRRDDGDFDYDRASLYWKFIWWLDATFGLFGGEIVSAVDKDD